MCAGCCAAVPAVLPARLPRGREHQDLHLGPDHPGWWEHGGQEPLRPVRPGAPRPEGQEGQEGVHTGGSGLAQ